MSLGRDVPSLPLTNLCPELQTSMVESTGGGARASCQTLLSPLGPCSTDPRCFLPVLFCSHFPVTPFLPALPGRFFIPSLPGGGGGGEIAGATSQEGTVSAARGRAEGNGRTDGRGRRRSGRGGRTDADGAGSERASDLVPSPAKRTQRASEVNERRRKEQVNNVESE